VKYLIVGLLGLMLTTDAWGAVNTRPSSGRRLARGHWLTCWGGSETVLRSDPHFHKRSNEEEVARYIPSFSGTYGFEVKDTWEEWVTRFGVSCGHCGETCSGSGQNRTCSCNSCSWQEKETFYRHWSHQRVNWKVAWNQDPAYRERRRKWLADGEPEISSHNTTLDKLLEFDPERPLEYFLFPGEVEPIEVSNGDGIFSSNDYIRPSVSIGRPRHDYAVRIRNSIGPESFLCDDRDFAIEALVQTGKRRVSYTPNSIEFRSNWVVSPKDASGAATETPGEFQLTDLSAMRYEQQNVLDNYKQTEVLVSLWQTSRFLWLIDSRVGQRYRAHDNTSILNWKKTDPSDKSPPVGVYNIPGIELTKSRILGHQFGLAPGKTYEVCTQMRRKNNIYYYQAGFWNGRWGGAWSDMNCGMFIYKPNMSNYNDDRSGWRKFQDGFLGRIVGFGIL